MILPRPLRRPAVRALVVLVPLAAVTLPAAAQPQRPPRPPAIDVVPAQPRQGRLVTIVVRGDRVPESVTLAGEPIHLEATGSRRSGPGAIPVDAPDSLAVVARYESGDSLVHWVRVRPGDFPVERLRVAPRFGMEPDSALEARTADESRRALEIGRRSHDTPRLWKGSFARPRPGRVTSAFGRGREYNGRVTGRHMGTDFAGANGTPVRATNRGVVALVDTFYYGGRVVYVDHGAGLVSAYMHLSHADVAVGDTVVRNQVIGRVGSTGRVTGPHLHWMVRYGAITVDPLTLPSLQPPTPARPRGTPVKAR